MKRILSIMLSLAMVMALFTGCGDKEAEKNSSFFKEVAKMQDVKTGTSELELAIDIKGTGVSKDEEIPAKLMNGDNLTLKVKMEAAVESGTKEAVKLSAQYGANDYAELTTIVVDGSKVYINAGAIVDFLKSIDESIGAEAETYLGQLGISEYVSVDLKQVCEAAGVETPDMSKSADSLQEVVKKMLENMDKAFTDIQGKDGDDYTLTVGSDNADKVADALVKFCDESLKETYTDIMGWYVDLFGADTKMGKQFAELKDDASKIDTATIKENKDKIVNGLKDANVNAVVKFNLTGEEGSRVGKLSIDSGEIKDTKEDITGKITLTSTVKEGEASIKEYVPTEGVIDMTAMVNAMMSSISGEETTEGGNTTLY